MRSERQKWCGLVLWLGLCWLLGCSQRSCGTSRSIVTPKVATCSLVRVLGREPVWEGTCESDRSCWRRSKGRLAWVRCISQTCVLGAGDEKVGHLHGVLAFVFLGKGQLLAGDAGGFLRLWDWKEGKTIGFWKAHSKPIRAVARTSQGILSGGDDTFVGLWNAKGKLFRRWSVNGRISQIAVSSDESWFAAASSNRVIWVGNSSAKPWVALRGHTEAVRGVAFHPSLPILASASDDRTIRIWNKTPTSAAFASRHVLRGHVGWVRRVRFVKEPKGRVSLLSGSFDQSLQWWDLEGRRLAIWGLPMDIWSTTLFSLPPHSKVAWQNQGGHQSDISSIDVSPSGRWVLSTGHRSSFVSLPDDGTTARVWDRRTGRVACYLQGHTLGLTQGAFAPDSRHFVTSSEDGTLRVFRIQMLGGDLTNTREVRKVEPKRELKKR